MEPSAGKKRKRTAGSPGEQRTGVAPSRDSSDMTEHVLEGNDGPERERSATIPRDVNVIAFAEKRSREIRTLLSALSEKKTNKRIFQQLPRHMRRRAMSYNVKRLPKRLRAAAAVEISRAKIPKRPRKKYRKCGRNKKLLFERRQKSKGWLETHVWHAKRFHMVEQWGYRLADHSNEKGLRAAFRASSEHCMMTDMSYLDCWELQGPQAELLEGIQKFVSPDTGRSFAYKDYLDGHMEGSCMLYEPGKYPTGAIGIARFTWMQLTSTEKVCSPADRFLHVWTHPSASAGFLMQLLRVYGMDPVSEERSDAEHSNEASVIQIGGITPEMGGVNLVEPMEVDPTSPAAKISPGEYRSSTCSVKLLKKDLVRIRLIGPKSTAVLKAVLKTPVKFSGSLDQDYWWKSYVAEDRRNVVMEEQCQIWTGMEAEPLATDVRGGSVLGLIVRDPRIFLPRKKVVLSGAENVVHVIPESTSSLISRLPVRSSTLAVSPLWSSAVRAQVKRDKLSDREMNKLRSELPAPGMLLDLGVKESRIPIVLVRIGGYSAQDGHSKTGYGAGWDVILPAGWAMSFWIPLVYSGARVAGLQEMSTVNRHRASLVGPADFPDTSAGELHGLTLRRELEAKFQRYPPDKRPNYIKMGTLAPFHSPWRLLVQDWCDITKFSVKPEPVDTDPTLPHGIHVIRDLRLLCLIQNLLWGVGSTESLVADHQDLIARHARGIVAVHLAFQAGGTSENFSMLSLPSTEDYEQISENRKIFKGPTEPAHPDPFRKTKPAKERRKLQVQSICSDKESVVDHCSRKLMGYIVKGGYSFIRGSETAIGFCSFLGILQLARIAPKTTWKRETVDILTRHPHSLQYHIVGLSLLPFSSDL